MTAAGFGHGKVILLGEHAVVYGHPALAAGLSAGISARARPGAGHIVVPGWDLEASAGDGSLVGRALEAILAELGAGELDFELEARIPPRAGLGSSAAMAVAIARAAARAAGKPEAGVAAAVTRAEEVFHGTPSGIDAAAAASGAVGCFRRGDGWRIVPVQHPVALCVGLSGRPRETAVQVEAVRRLRARAPVADRILDTLGAIAATGVEALAANDLDKLGCLFDMAHGLLAALRVSSLELDALVHGARAAGASGAKLTGAGGGGAVIALAGTHGADILRRWRADGFDGFLTEIGGREAEPGTERSP